MATYKGPTLCDECEGWMGVIGTVGGGNLTIEWRCQCGNKGSYSLPKVAPGFHLMPSGGEER